MRSKIVSPKKHYFAKIVVFGSMVKFFFLVFDLSFLPSNIFGLIIREPSQMSYANDAFPFALITDEEVDRLFPDLPPDPGEEGKKTLEGIVSGSDGVRDDIKRLIYRIYPYHELRRKALLQYAKALQEGIAHAHNKLLSIEKTKELFKAATCAEGIFKIGTNNDKERLEAYHKRDVELELIRQMSLNTEARIKADLLADVNFSGQTYSLILDELSACDFEVN